jgi:hypothetical protein
MGMPNYFRPKAKLTSLSEITGGMNPDEVRVAISEGARFLAFEYVISAILISSRRYSKLIYLRPGETYLRRALPYTILTALAGWWGVPHGIINTPSAIYRNLKGGKDFTPQILASLHQNSDTNQIVFRS